MDRLSFEAWLTSYGKAWESRNPEAAVRLYAEDATYQETPFAAPMRGRDTLLRYWTHVAETQESIQFGFEILAVTPDLGFARWWASFLRVPLETPLELNGIFAIALDGQNQCTSLREWWHRRELPSA